MRTRLEQKEEVKTKVDIKQGARKKDYEIAVEDFEEADRKYRELEEFFNSGGFLDNCAGEEARSNFLAILDELRKSLEERNVKLKEAQNALRAAVQLSIDTWRGPEGKPEIIKVGSMQVSSVTRRSFDPKTLLEKCEEKGILDQILSLKGMDNNGNEYNLVQQTWDIDYQGVLTWLRQHDMTDVIDAAYDEKEVTPQVKGAKKVAFLGEKVDK